MHAIGDGYRGLQLVVSLNSDRLVFLAVIAVGLVGGTLGASFLGTLN
ncbi:MAG: hypothetical protein HZT43_07315 [Exiguobacterium profundum]|nr:MAG: hypothetical protein HZT43_07315 [Exiguobacterium profundum]